MWRYDLLILSRRILNADTGFDEITYLSISNGVIEGNTDVPKSFPVNGAEVKFESGKMIDLSSKDRLSEDFDADSDDVLRAQLI